MGRRKLDTYPPWVAAKMRADLAENMRTAWENGNFDSRVNGALREDVQEKISESVKTRWAEGKYDLRVNGMTGMTGSKQSQWVWGRRHYREILLQYEPMVCRFCGESEEKIDAHHLDENKENYLITNLLWTCVPCHMWKMHYNQGFNQSVNRHKLPVIEISRSISFEYAHILPWHPGKCAQLHGHSGNLEIFVKGRLDPNGVVMDFKDIGEAVKLSVHDVLDHRFLNDYITNPTSENLIVWIWFALESIGLKGLSRVTFSETDSSTCSITSESMIEAFGWDKDSNGKWCLVHKIVRSKYERANS